jgi:hypothetical protein
LDIGHRRSPGNCRRRDGEPVMLASPKLANRGERPARSFARSSHHAYKTKNELSIPPQSGKVFNSR